MLPLLLHGCRQIIIEMQGIELYLVQNAVHALGCVNAKYQIHVILQLKITSHDYSLLFYFGYAVLTYSTMVCTIHSYSCASRPRPAGHGTYIILFHALARRCHSGHSGANRYSRLLR